MVVGGGVMKEWLSVAELAKESEIPESTARRYLDRHERFFRCEQRARGRRYHRDSVVVLARIQSLYAQGLEASDVDSTLSMEFAISIDNHPSTTPPPSLAAPIATRDDLVQAFAAIHREMEQMKNELAATRSFIDERLEERDRKLMETLRLMQQQAEREASSRKKSWWPWSK